MRRAKAGNADDRRCHADERRWIQEGHRYVGRWQFDGACVVPQSTSSQGSAFIGVGSAFIGVSQDFRSQHSLTPHSHMPNRLANETSPYLQQHAENPVDWYPWGEEAFERARAEDRPIFLSVGYSACHWCHVMEHESFANPATAALMNEHFVNVKVDREERPDVDALYMEAAVTLNRSGGWPLSLFLTPEGRPFWAATYLPP